LIGFVFAEFDCVGSDVEKTEDEQRENQ
jgi:hypothetical protein